jgi:hypothetical protein
MLFRHLCHLNREVSICTKSFFWIFSYWLAYTVNFAYPIDVSCSSAPCAPPFLLSCVDLFGVFRSFCVSDVCVSGYIFCVSVFEGVCVSSSITGVACESVTGSSSFGIGANLGKLRRSRNLSRLSLCIANIFSGLIGKMVDTGGSVIGFEVSADFSLYDP